MSATLETSPVARFLGGCPVMRSEGRPHPLDIRFTTHSGVPLDAQAAASV